MEITFVEEKIPKIEKAGGSGRAAEPWENHLAPRKEHQGVSARMAEFTAEGETADERKKKAKGKAQNRVSAIRKRLDKQVANENWDFAVRPTPEDPEKFAVYVTYNGTFTNEQIVENARKRQAHSDAVKAARAASVAAKNGSDPEAISEPDTPTSPKEKATAGSRRPAK